MQQCPQNRFFDLVVAAPHPKTQATGNNPDIDRVMVQIIFFMRHHLQAVGHRVVVQQRNDVLGDHAANLIAIEVILDEPDFSQMLFQYLYGIIVVRGKFDGNIQWDFRFFRCRRFQFRLLGLCNRRFLRFMRLYRF